MSGSHPGPRRSQDQSSCLTQPLSDSSTLTEKLEGKGQARRGWDKTWEMEALEEDSEPENIACPSEQGYASGEFHEEIRCFQLPRAIVRREYELLREHRLEDFSHLLHGICEDLAPTLLLMRNLDAATEFSSYDLSLIGPNLSRPIALLDAICSPLDDCEWVQKRTVPA